MKHWGEKFSSRKSLEKKKDGKLIGFYNANAVQKIKGKSKRSRKYTGPKYTTYVWKYEINTQYMTNPTIVYLIKMEYGWDFSISGLKIIVKIGLEKLFLKFFHAQAIFY